MSLQKKKRNGSPRAAGATMIELVLAAPVAFMVSMVLYFGLGPVWVSEAQRVIVTGVVFLASVMLVNWHFGLKPMRALRAGVRELGRSNLKFRFAADQDDEFGQIGRQFNRLLEALEKAEKETDRLREVVQSRGEAKSPVGTVETVGAAVQRFTGGMDLDLVAQSAVHSFLKDLRADRCLIVVCHEATNVLSLEAVGQEAGQKISERISTAAFPKSEQELMAMSGWPAWERAQRWGADPFLDVLSEPVEAGGVFLGYVAVYREKRWKFSENDRQLFEALVSMVAVVLQNQRLQERSLTDGLTGVLTRRAMEEVVEQEFAKAKMTGLPLSVLMVDVDRFKEVNDQLGHAAGDEVLRRIAKGLKGCVRAADYAFRYGGDEFLILLIGTSLEGALGVGRRIVGEVASIKDVPRLASEVDAGVSVGVACFPIHATDKVELMALADRAMYEAKREGGGRLKVAVAEKPGLERQD